MYIRNSYHRLTVKKVLVINLRQYEDDLKVILKIYIFFFFLVSI